jgi:hypothetical protein
MVPYQYIGRHPLALIHHPEPRQNSGEEVCRLCATERVIMGQNLTGSSQRQRKILNLKWSMHYAFAKQGSYGSQDPTTREGGSDDKGEEKPEKRACEGLPTTEGGIFGG